MSRHPDSTPLMRNGERNPTGDGRYCAPRRCYCGECLGYAEQVAEAERAYQRELRRALASLA